MDISIDLKADHGSNLPDDLPPNIAAAIDELPMASALLGLRVQSIDTDEGSIEVIFETGKHLRNKWGAIQGGMIAAMMDDVTALAAGLQLDWGQIVPTLEMKVNYIAPCRPGKIRGTASTVRRGKSVIFIEGALYNEDGALAATGSATFSVVTLKKKDK